MPVTLVVPKVVAERVRKEAGRLGVSVEEYLVELVSRGLDLKGRARVCAEAAVEVVEQAEEELEEGGVRQAAEKVWGACALAVKAYAYWRDGRRLVDHRDLWEYKDVVASDLGEWVAGVLREACSVHVCFYEGWCTRRDVESVLEGVGKLVRAVAEKVLK